MGCRRKYSMISRRLSPLTARNSTAMSPPARSTITTRPVSLRSQSFRTGGAKAHYDGIVAFSQTDQTEDLKKITIPVLVMHSEDDQIVPYADAGPLSAK